MEKMSVIEDSNARMALPKGAKLLLVGNAALTGFLLWGTTFVILHPMDRWPSFGRIRAPYLAILLAIILALIIKGWRGSRRAINWMVVLYSIFVGVCIWDGAMIVANAERLGIEVSQLTAISWMVLLYAPMNCLWLGLNVWYFYGRWGMVPRTS
jgi:hypothetical protein